MNQSAERFHKAARDGFLDLLRETTKKDCNSPDEDGMTPTLWAAYHGNLDALRLLVGRGGDPDKCDYFGNTALHCASANGQINCVSFLVNFGANLWALDNDFHTPKDLAGMNERTEILKYLDQVIARQSALNKKVVASLKQKAITDAEKRVKILQKMQKKSAKKAEKEDKKLMKQTKKGLQENGNGSVVGTLLKKDTRGASHKYSDIVNNGTMKRGPLTGVSRKVHQKKQEMSVNNPNSDFKVRDASEGYGKTSLRSLTGLRRDSEVMYMPKYDQQSNGSCGSSQGSSDRRKLQDVFKGSNHDLSRATSEPEFLYNAGTDSGIGEDGVHESGSIFERPGFGSVAFRNSLSGTLMAVPPSKIDDEDEDHDSARVSDPRSGGSANDSIGSAGSLARRNRRMISGWDDEDQGMEDDGEECDNESSVTELFLMSHGLAEFIPIFVREKIDLESMMLLQDPDLKDLGLPMGPRKKMLKAIAERKLTLDEPGEVYDSKL